MRIILLSGGSGKRLWPLSNDSRSKQFLKVLKNERGILESMVQRVWRQLEDTKLSDQVLIATSKTQVEMIRSQVGEKVEIITEPSRKDTFMAIALAASYAYSVKKDNLDTIVVTLPVDAYVEDVFYKKLKNIEEVLTKSNSDLTLIGVKPTIPSSKYGYIVPVYDQEDRENYYLVKHFVEKPSTLKAKELLKENAFWNCGVFGFKLSFLIETMISMGISTDYYELVEQYNSFDKKSFDYEVVEETENISVIPYDGYWKDLGTWNTLTEEMGTGITGKGVMSKETLNSHIVNELDIPITLIGLDNVLVAASPDGILVTDKELSPKVKEYVNDFENRPMYEERRWGWYRVLEYTKYSHDNEVLIKRLNIASGNNLSYHTHSKRTELWTVIKGSGYCIIENTKRKISAGTVISIPIGVKHAIKAIDELEIVEVQTGSELVEEDIQRISIEWNEILQYCN